MTEQLKAIDLRYSELEARLAANETYSDPELVSRLNREQKELEPLVTAYRAICRAKEDLAGAEALLSDPEMRELAQEEYDQARADVGRLEQEIRLLLLPRDPNDDKNVIIGDGVVAIQEEGQIVAIEGIVGTELGKGLTAVGDAGGQPPVDGVLGLGIGLQVGEVVIGKQLAVAAVVVRVAALGGGVVTDFQLVAAGLEGDSFRAGGGHQAEDHGGRHCDGDEPLEMFVHCLYSLRWMDVRRRSGSADYHYCTGRWKINQDRMLKEFVCFC